MEGTIIRYHTEITKKLSARSYDMTPWDKTVRLFLNIVRTAVMAGLTPALPVQVLLLIR